MKVARSILGLCCAAFVAATLASCGNSPDANNAKGGLPVAKQLIIGIAAQANLKPNAPPDRTTSPGFRKVLEQAGTPFYRVAVAAIKYVNVMAPYGQNGNVQTWASATKETTSDRAGVLVATRGFGPDLMTAVAPDLAQISSSNGTFHRVYYYLDGADQPQSLAFDCSFAASGSETLTLMGLSYATRRVVETCSSATSHIENVYWFDGSGKLRQSDQFVSPQLAYMRLQRIID